MQLHVHTVTTALLLRFAWFVVCGLHGGGRCVVTWCLAFSAARDQHWEMGSWWWCLVWCMAWSLHARGTHTL